jgi:hypothetical protein
MTAIAHATAPVTERPLLMSGPLVRATLEGRKRQTRRPLRLKFKEPWELLGEDARDRPWPMRMDEYGDYHPIPCPWGVPGDVLWVRETWAHYQTIGPMKRPDGGAFSEVSDGLAGYRADGHDSIEDFRRHVALMGGLDVEAVEINGDCWRPSIHMPKWACRLRLRITEVRAERVQDISEEDAEAEGCAGTPSGLHPAGDDGESPREEFRRVWDSLYPGTWDTAWCWALTFAVVT